MLEVWSTHTYVCTYMCICIHIYIYIYIYLYIYICTWELSINALQILSTEIHAYIHTYVCSWYTYISPIPLSGLTQIHFHMHARRKYRYKFTKRLNLHTSKLASDYSKIKEVVALLHYYSNICRSSGMHFGDDRSWKFIFVSFMSACCVALSLCSLCREIHISITWSHID